MKTNNIFMGLALFSLFFLGCEDNKVKTVDPIQIITSDVNNEPQLYSFVSNEFINSTYDIKIMSGTQTYLMGLNSSAGVMAAVGMGNDFNSAVMPTVGYSFDMMMNDEYVIGDNWMDVSTYNPMDHSISSNGMVHFIRTADYRWVKLQITKASPSEFFIKYAIMNSEGVFGNTMETQVAYTTDEPSYFRFSTGETLIPDIWHIGFTNVPEYSSEVNQFFYMPSLVFNSDENIQVGSVRDVPYEDIDEVPASISWENNLRNFGLGGSDPILVYHPEPPYNHKVIVENPEHTLIININGKYYKMRFVEYSSGVVLTEYNEL